MTFQNLVRPIFLPFRRILNTFHFSHLYPIFLGRPLLRCERVVNNSKKLCHKFSRHVPCSHQVMAEAPSFNPKFRQYSNKFKYIYPFGFNLLLISKCSSWHSYQLCPMCSYWRIPIWSQIFGTPTMGEGGSKMSKHFFVRFSCHFWQFGTLFIFPCVANLF